MGETGIFEDMTEDLDHFYLSQPEPNRSCFLTLRSIILKQDERINETKKYGMPCFCYGKKMFCYLWTDKKTREPYILMVEGKLLDHPSLVQGDRARMKTLSVNANADLELDVITSVLQAGLELYRNGTVKT